LPDEEKAKAKVDLAMTKRRDDFSRDS